MKAVIVRLGAWGCDIKGALERMCEDEEFYIECLRDIAGDPCFAALKRALDTGDLPAAFDAAHTLKGVFANMGLTPMYDKVVEIVEPLRRGSGEDLSGRYAQLMERKAQLEDILARG